MQRGARAASFEIRENHDFRLYPIELANSFHDEIDSISA
jgi:hypothetical protein